MSRQVNTTSADSFATRLNARLTGTTSESFARRIDVTLRTVQRWRAGESEPQGSALIRVARELNCDPADLYPPIEDRAA